MCLGITGVECEGKFTQLTSWVIWQFWEVLQKTREQCDTVSGLIDCMHIVCLANNKQDWGNILGGHDGCPESYTNTQWLNIPFKFYTGLFSCNNSATHEAVLHELSCKENEII